MKAAQKISISAEDVSNIDKSLKVHKHLVCKRMTIADFGKLFEIFEKNLVLISLFYYQKNR